MGTFSVLINGRPGSLFRTQRGVRQGDPASLYLFLMGYMVTSGKLLGFQPGTGVTISHLLFVDDTLIFLDSSIEEVRLLKEVLHGFELCSGLKINYFKTSLIPIGDCLITDQCASLLGCKVGSIPFTYLGLPIGAGFKAATIWRPFVEKLESRLAI